MKSNKGFTLIELLAVIVILAIVALVATPVILNIIQSSTDNAKESSSRLVIKSVELAYTTYTSRNNGTAPTITQLRGEFTDMMDSGTSWTSDEGPITASNGEVSCTIAISSNVLTVTCPKFKSTTASDIQSRPLTLSPTQQAQQGGGGE